MIKAKIKHEYLRSRASRCLSLWSSSSDSYLSVKSLRFFCILMFIEILVLISWIPASGNFVCWKTVSTRQPGGISKNSKLQNKPDFSLSLFAKETWGYLPDFFKRLLQHTLWNTIKIWIIHSHTLAHSTPKISAEWPHRHSSNWLHSRATEAKNRNFFQFSVTNSCIYVLVFRALIPMWSLHHLQKFHPNWLTGSPAIDCGIRQPRWKTAFFTIPPKVPNNKSFLCLNRSC